MGYPKTIHTTAASVLHKTLYDEESIPVGTGMDYEDGRKFRFALAGELLVPGEILEGEQISTEDDLTCAAGSIGDKSITLTSQGTEVANYYKGGYIFINTTPGLADNYKIDGHLLLTSGSGDIINLAEGESLKRALTTDSRASILRNPWRGLVTLATTALGFAAGVAVSAIPSGEWGWVQTGGPCAVFGGAADIEGIAFAAADDTAGFGITKDALGEFVIGQVMLGGTQDGDASLVYLTLD